MSPTVADHEAGQAAAVERADASDEWTADQHGCGEQVGHRAEGVYSAASSGAATRTKTIHYLLENRTVEFGSTSSSSSSSSLP